MTIRLGGAAELNDGVKMINRCLYHEICVVFSFASQTRDTIDKSFGGSLHIGQVYGLVRLRDVLRLDYTRRYLSASSEPELKLAHFGPNRN